MARPRTVSKLVYEDKETGCHIIEYADVGHIVSRFLCPGEKQSTEVFCKKGVLRNFAKLTEKDLCQSLFFNKVAGLPFYIEHLWWLPLSGAVTTGVLKISCTERFANISGK